MSIQNPKSLHVPEWRDRKDEAKDVVKWRVKSDKQKGNRLTTDAYRAGWDFAFRKFNCLACGEEMVKSSFVRDGHTIRKIRCDHCGELFDFDLEVILRDQHPMLIENTGYGGVGPIDYSTSE
jgi:DNA-directed RNA polymerase subunit RPC12/RpoP